MRALNRQRRTSSQARDAAGGGETRTVWFVNHYAGDPRTATSGTRHFDLGVELAALGWHATVIAADVSHPSGTPMFKRKFGDLQEAELEGVRFRWVRTPRYDGSSVRRLLNMVWFSWALLWPKATRDLPTPTIIVGSTVHPLAAWSASVLARRRRVPFVFEIRDLWPETFVSMGVLDRHHPVARALYRLESSLIRRASAVVTTMPYAEQYIRARGHGTVPVHWVSNGVSPDKFPLGELPVRETCVVSYFGSVGAANALHVLIAGFAEAAMQFDNLRLRIVGDGPDKDSLQTLVANLGLVAVVEFCQPVPKNEVPALAADSDALAVVLLPLPVYKYGISLNKLFEYLSSNRPILFAGAADSHPILGIRGVVQVDPTPEGVGNGLTRIAALSQRERQELASLNRTVAEGSFSFRALARVYDELLDNLTSRRTV